MENEKQEESDLTKRLKEIRKALQINQRDFAERLGISGPSISEIEKGKYKPNFDFLYELAKEFKVNLYYLMFGEGDMFIGEKPITVNNDSYITQSKVNHLFHYFERSPQVQLALMSAFNRVLSEDRELINEELAAYEKKYKK